MMSKRINVEVDEKLWHKVSVRAAVNQSTKADLVHEALEYYLSNVKPDDDEEEAKK